MQTTTSIPPLSQSRQTLMACSYLYMKRIISGLSEADNKYSLRGREVHDFLAEYVTHLVDTRQRQDIGHFNMMLDGSGLTADAIDILAAMRDGFEVDPDQVLCCEKRLYLDAEFNPVILDDDVQAKDVPEHIHYEGKPDLVLLLNGSEARIPDYKSQFQIVDADTFQGRLYSLLVMLHYPFVEKVTFELQFVRYGRASRSVTYTRSDIPHLKGLVSRERDRQLVLHQAASPETLSAMPGPHCAFCPLLHTTCPIKETNVHAEQSPEDRLRFEIWAKEALKVNEQVLKAHVNVHGAVRVQDDNSNLYIREFQLKERTFYPALATLQQVTDWIKQGGDDFTVKQDGSERLRIGATELKPMLKAKKRAPLAEKINGVKQVEQYTQFSLAGVDADDEGD